MTEPTTCPLCGREFQPRGRQLWCPDACRQKAFRRRQASSSTQPAPMTSPASRDFIVYVCPACEQRYLGAQYCPDCQTFCRRVGPGGLCLHCDEPVAHVDLTYPA